MDKSNEITFGPEHGNGLANDVAKDQERINEVFLKEDNELIRYGRVHKGTKGVEETKSSGLTAQRKMSVDEANKIIVEKPTPTEKRKMEFTGDDVTLANGVKSIPQKVNTLDKMILKERVVNKKPVVRSDIGTMEAATLRSLLGDETSGETNITDVSEGVKNEELVPADSGMMKAKEEETSTVGSVKAGHGKTNGRKRKRLKKKFVEKKVVLCGTVASVIEAGPQSVDNDAPVEGNQKDTHKEKNDDKKEAKPTLWLNRNLRRHGKKAVLEDHAGLATGVGEENENVMADEMGNKESKETGELDSKRGREVKSSDNINSINNPLPSESSRSSRGTEIKGMIFMCNSETKKDCYHYKVFGLPGNKKDIVSKIYEGMILFLFDVTQRTMHGIYKAASPGGYNIEPRAFNSAFPSQVRFVVVKDCLPLSEIKFKAAIKDNYFKGNRFRFELTSAQVEHLCRLFSEPNPTIETHILNAPSSSHQDRKRKQAVDGRETSGNDTRKVGHISALELEITRRQTPGVMDDRHHLRYGPVYERPPYLLYPAAATSYQHIAVQNPPPTPSYSLDPSSQNLVSYAPNREIHANRGSVYETRVRLVAEYGRDAEYRAPLPPYRRY